MNTKHSRLGEGVRKLYQEGYVEGKLLSRRTITQSGCWEWTGPKDRQGYGVFTLGGYHSVHRIAFVWWIGSIPHGFYVCHSCDNPSCFNPDHLFVGTPKDNADDMIAKGRRCCSQGSNNPRSVLSEADVRAIRTWLELGARGVDVARFYSVSPATISNIRQDKAWRHAKGAHHDS